MKPKAEYTETPGNRYDVMTYRTYVFGAAIVLFGGIGVYMMVTKPYMYPLLTIFFYSIPANCAISIVPHDPVMVWYGKTVNLWYLSIAATLGTLLACYIDYRFFTPVLNLRYSAKYKSHYIYKKCHLWFYKLPFLSLTVAGFIPIIPFSPFKFMVYSSKYSLLKYLLAVMAGRFPRYCLLALVGYSFQVPNWLIAGSFLILLGMVNYRKIFGWTTRPFVALFRLLKSHSLANGDKSETR